MSDVMGLENINVGHVCLGEKGENAVHIQRLSGPLLSILSIFFIPQDV